MSKITRLDWSKTAKQFSVNSRGKFLCQYLASRQAGKQALSLEPFFLRILDTFHILSFYFSEIYFLFCFGQMFHGFWTSNFDLYWSLALQFSFSCIIFMYFQSKAFRRQFSFCSSQRLVSVKNELLQYLWPGLWFV